MASPILEIYPEHGRELALEGLYLGQDLRAQLVDKTDSFVYANFITSLDGRIAIPRENNGLVVPKTIINPRDWRLFQELAIQADVIISSGRYLRDYAEDHAQEILGVYDDPGLADLADWRRDQGLPLHPAIAIISASLSFPIPPALIEGERQVIILTTQNAPKERKQILETQGLEVLTVSDKNLTGHAVVEALQKNGYRLIYSAAGPRILHLLLDAGVLNRLYLTFAARIVGGTPFSSILEGQLLSTPAEFTLQHMFLDPDAPGPGGQLFSAYNCVTPS